jgi:predicted Fe-Mo cluster-binding NifX family protein
MKIAVPTNDGNTLSEHFGRSDAFLVFEIENGRITGRDLRPNNGCHPHDHDSNQSGHTCNHDSQPAHSHAGIVAAISDCEVVLCGGMGPRAADALRQSGISPVFVNGSGIAEQIVQAYADGTLQPAAASSCHCDH